MRGAAAAHYPPAWRTEAKGAQRNAMLTAGPAQHCAFCGAEAHVRMPRCAECSLLYCSSSHQREAWNQGHQLSCGDKLPVPSGIKMLSAVQLVRVANEYGGAHHELAMALIAAMDTVLDSKAPQQAGWWFASLGALQHIARYQKHPQELVVKCMLLVSRLVLNAPPEVLIPLPSLAASITSTSQASMTRKHLWS
eukprot:3580228-Pleurochrysis_carterae.AAC.1